MYYSKKENSFYDKSLKERYGNNWPSDAVEINDDLYISLLNAQSAGKSITSDDNGYPILIDRPPRTTEQLTETALAMRDVLLEEAAIRIAPLQDAIDLDEATDDEIAKLKAWKKYRVALNRIEQQSGFPNTIEWPVKPS